MVIEYLSSKRLIGLASDRDGFPVNGLDPNWVFIENDTLQSFLWDGTRWVTVGGINTDELKAYWKWDNPVTPAPNDSSASASLGTNADLAITGVAVYEPTGGIIGDSWLFDGGRATADTGTNQLSQWNFLHNTVAVWTINIWYKLATADGDERGEIISTSLVTTDIGIRFDYDNRTAQVHDHALLVQIANGNSGSEVIPTTFFENLFPNDTNWHLLTMTYNSALGSNQFTARVDAGNKVFATRQNAESNANATGALTIANTATGTAIPFNASFDETSIFNRVLEDGEVVALWNGGAGQEL